MSDFYAQYDENADAPITQEQLSYCRNRKFVVETKNKWFLIAHIAIGIQLFVLSMFMSAMVGKDPAVEGPWKFYVGFTLAAAEILFAGAIISLALWAHSMKKHPAYALMGLFLAHLLYTLLASYHYMEVFHVLVDVAGIALNYVRLSIVSESDWLKKQPGYPYFSEAMTRSNEYELPKYITHRRPPSEDMDSIGTITAASQTPKQTVLPSVSAESAVLADMATPERRISEAASHLPAALPSDTVLQSLQETVDAALPTQTSIQAEPTVSPASMLEDMSVPEKRQTGGALPDPEEVKARLRRMATEKESTAAQE